MSRLDREKLSTSEAFKQQFDSMSKLLRTCVPAIVVGFDPDRNLVDVQPCNMTKLGVDEEPLELPIVNHVPVVFFGADTVWQTVEPKPDDYCLLIVADRSIDILKLEGGVVDPEASRHHEITDSFALMGFNPYENAILEIEPDTLHTRTRDGEHGVRVLIDKVELHSKTAHHTVEPELITSEVPGTKTTHDGTEIVAEAGSSKQTIDQSTIQLEASSNITLTVGGTVITVTNGAVTITGATTTTVSGDVIVEGDTFIGPDAISFLHHVHGGVVAGAALTTPPEA